MNGKDTGSGAGIPDACRISAEPALAQLRDYLFGLRGRHRPPSRLLRPGTVKARV
jgi:hypothetical protein